MAKTAVKVAAKVVVTPKPVEVRDKPKKTYNPNAIADVYLKTNVGVTMLIGKDADEIRERIEQDKRHTLDYTFFDDDKKRWAYWGVMDSDGNLSPPHFPNVREYSLTSLQLYTKAVTYVRVMAHAIGLLREKPATLWGRMLKPTTIIAAIVGIVFCMGLMLLALTG